MLIPDHGFEFFPSRIRIKAFKYFNKKNGFSALGNMIRAVHPGSRSRFFTHPGSQIQGSKKGCGSRIRIRNTASDTDAWTEINKKYLSPQHMSTAVSHAGRDALGRRGSRAPPHQLCLRPQQLVQLAEQGMNLHDYLPTHTGQSGSVQ
jgi:hypothetical protein